MKIKITVFLSLISILIAIPAISAIWRQGYYPMHDDLQLMRQLEMDKCFKDKQIPCRWVPDMGYGYGYPLFNFYPPFPYYLGQVFRSLGLTYITTVKIVFTLGFVVSAVGMYLLAETFWGPAGGLVSSVFYIYAPYHATDLYVRGAINEFWAIAWYPFVLLGIYKVISSKSNKNIAFLALFTSLLMLSHNPMLMIFTIISLIWAFYWMFEQKSLLALKRLIISAIWALGLAGFFTLPVLFEQKLVHVETLTIGYFNYLAHFLDLRQLFIKMNWGYGESVFGPNDTMSFNIGYLHSIVWLAVTLLGLFKWKKDKKFSRVVLLISGTTLLYTFMTHWKATAIWQHIKPLEFLQFPWRLLSVIIFGTSFIAGSLVRDKAKSSAIVAALLIIAVVVTNVRYFQWRDKWPWVTDEHKFSGELWRLQTTAGIFDYLPKWIPLPPANPPQGDAQIISGVGTTHTDIKLSNYQKYNVEVYSDYLTWQLNSFYFPGWTYFINNHKITVNPQQDLNPEYGIPRFSLKQGTYVIEAKLLSTPTQRLGNILSAISWTSLIVLVFYWWSLHSRITSKDGKTVNS